MLKIYQLRKNQNTFEVTLKYKGVSVPVAFVDGNTYNNTPAKCYTNDVFKQKAIENSQMFKSKEIVLEREVEEKGDRKAATAKVVLQTKAKQPQPQKPAPVKPAPAPEPAEPANTADEQEQADAAPAGDGMEKMTFDNLADAIQYIATNYQQQVQTPNEARNFLKEKGIKATIKMG